MVFNIVYIYRIVPERYGIVSTVGNDDMFTLIIFLPYVNTGLITMIYTYTDDDDDDDIDINEYGVSIKTITTYSYIL